jgi:hypothetical protein
MVISIGKSTIGNQKLEIDYVAYWKKSDHVAQGRQRYRERAGA